MSLDKPMDHEDLLEKICYGLGSEYQSCIDVVNDRDIPISFDELHEKLINKEIALQQQYSLSFVIPSAENPIAPRPRSGWYGPRHQRPPFPLSPPYPPSLALEAVNHHHGPFLVVVSGVVFKGP